MLIEMILMIPHNQSVLSVGHHRNLLDEHVPLRYKYVQWDEIPNKKHPFKILQPLIDSINHKNQCYTRRTLK